MWGQCRIFQNFIPDRWLNVAASTLLSFQQVFQVLPGTCNYLRFSQALHAWRCDLLTEQRLLWDCNGLTTKLVRVRKGGSQWRKVQDSAWKRPETSLEVQWLTLQAPSAGGAGSIAGRGTEISHAAYNGQKKKGQKRLFPPSPLLSLRKDAASGWATEDESGREPARKGLSLRAQAVAVPPATPEQPAAPQLRGWRSLITSPLLKRRTSSPFFGKRNCSLLSPSTFSISTTEFYKLGRIFLKTQGWASLVVQWLRIWLPMQGTWV